jgi:outer membrane receptor protein involved in Fe transport
MLKLSRSSILRSAIAALCIPGAVLAQQQQQAQTGPQAEPQTLEEITVTGTRIVRSGMITPVPTTAVQADELQNMSAGPLFDALVQLPPFFANQAPEQVNGGQNSGGSNLNLRGAGLNRTLVLLDGRRIVPTNRFGAVDVAMFPEELISSVEVVTGGASASYGTDAVAGVVNFKLDTDFEGYKGHLQAGQTTYSDGDTYEAGFAFGTRIGERGHLIGSIEKFNVDPISGFHNMEERSFFNNVARVTNPATTGPNNFVRPYVEPTTWNQTGIINHLINPTTPGPLDKLVFRPDGTVTPLVFSGDGQLNGGCACQSTGVRNFGSDVDNEVAAGNERETLLLHYEHELSDNMSIYAQTLLGQNEVTDRRENISFILTWAPRLFADNVYLPPALAAQIAATGLTADQPATYPRYVNFALFGVNDGNSGLPDVRQITKNDLMSNTIGFDAQLDRDGWLDGWRINAYYQHGNNEQNFDTDNGIRVDRIPLAFDAVMGPNGPACYAALANPAVFGDCVPMNIFGGLQNLTPAARNYIVDDYKVAFQDTTQDFVELVMTGDLWDGWGAGAIAGAFGASYRSEDLNQSTPDPTDEFPATPSGVLLETLGVIPVGIRGLIEEYRPGGQVGSGIRNVPSGFRGDANSSAITFSSLRAIAGGYDVREAFGELNIPIASDAGWANQFDISTAVRWADYSGSGEIWAGKLGMNWQVTDAVRLRATQSRDVRAATLRERFDQTRGGVTVNDPQKGGASISTASFSGGNPNVNPEKADTTTAGIVFQPKGVEGLSVSFDWYNIDINGAIAQLASQAVVNGCVPPAITSLCEYVIRDPVTNDIVRVDNLFINLQRQVIEGTDLELTYRFGNFGLRTFVTHLMENSVQSPGGIVDDRAGDIGGANAGLPDLKVTANLSWDRGPFSMFVQERYIGGGKLDRFLIEGDRSLLLNVPATIRSLYSTIDDNSIPSTYYTDLGVRFAFGRDDAWEVFGNINNLFDQEPRATAQILGRAGVNEFNSSAQLYDILGRTMTVGARLSF